MEPGGFAGLMAGIGQGMMDPEMRHAYNAGGQAYTNSINKAHESTFMKHQQDHADLMRNIQQRRAGMNQSMNPNFNPGQKGELPGNQSTKPY